MLTQDQVNELAEDLYIIANKRPTIPPDASQRETKCILIIAARQAILNMEAQLVRVLTRQ